jgi:hypothetical protein
MTKGNGRVPKRLGHSIGLTNIKVRTNLTFVIPTGAYPDFLLRCRRQDRVCGFP